MNIQNKIEFRVDISAKFHHSLRLEGWFVSNKKISKIKVIGSGIHGQSSDLYIDYPQVTIDNARGWVLNALFDHEFDPLSLKLKISFYFSRSIYISLKDLIDERISFEVNTPKVHFHKLVSDFPGSKLLDVGGRDRSLVDRSKSFPGSDVVVLDILPGDNVDVVGDAHCLSQYFPKDHFDFAMSYCVFEHLHSPWKVAIELNKVLKKDGYALIITHQTLGLHDMPWDYFRFSNESFKSLFNQYTGFEVVDISMLFPSYITPFLYRSDKKDSEKSAGYELSTVLIRKISESTASWDFNLTQVLNEAYPENPTSFDPTSMELPY